MLCCPASWFHCLLSLKDCLLRPHIYKHKINAPHHFSIRVSKVLPQKCPTEALQWWVPPIFSPKPSPLPSVVAVFSTDRPPPPGSLVSSVTLWLLPLESARLFLEHVWGEDRHPACAHPTKIATNYKYNTSHFLSFCGGEHRRSCTERWHLLRALAPSGLRWKLSGRIKLRVSALVWGWHRGSSAELPCSLPPPCASDAGCPVVHGMFSQVIPLGN